MAKHASSLKQAGEIKRADAARGRSDFECVSLLLQPAARSPRMGDKRVPCGTDDMRETGKEPRP